MADQPLPTLGARRASLFEPTRVAGWFKISIRRQLIQFPHARIESVNAEYAQSCSIDRLQINDGPTLGNLFSLGGDGMIGKTPTDWAQFGPVQAPVDYRFTPRSWYFGKSTSSGLCSLDGSLYEHGLYFKLSIDDAGRWAHGAGPDGDCNDLIIEFALVTTVEPQPSWNAQFNSNHKPDLLVLS